MIHINYVWKIPYRLQYFARGSQAYHAQLRTTLKEGGADAKDEQVIDVLLRY